MELSPKHQVHWQQLPDMPVGKWEPASLVLNDKLHVLGGYEDNIVSSRRQHLFDPADGSWTESCKNVKARSPMSIWSRVIRDSGSLAV